MTKIRKYHAGHPLTIAELCREIAVGNYVMCRGTPVHPGWAGSWQINMAAGMCRAGIIREALLTPEWAAAHPPLDTEFAEV